MFFAVPAAAMAGFLIEHFGKAYFSYEGVFLIGSVLTLINIVLLYFYKDEEMISKKTRRINQVQNSNTTEEN